MKQPLHKIGDVFIHTDSEDISEQRVITKAVLMGDEWMYRASCGLGFPEYNDYLLEEEITKIL